MADALDGIPEETAENTDRSSDREDDEGAQERRPLKRLDATHRHAKKAAPPVLRMAPPQKITQQKRRSVIDDLGIPVCPLCWLLVTKPGSMVSEYTTKLVNNLKTHGMLDSGVVQVTLIKALEGDVRSGQCVDVYTDQSGTMLLQRVNNHLENCAPVLSQIPVKLATNSLKRLYDNKDEDCPAFEHLQILERASRFEDKLLKR